MMILGNNTLVVTTLEDLACLSLFLKLVSSKRQVKTLATFSFKVFITRNEYLYKQHMINILPFSRIKCIFDLLFK